MSMCICKDCGGLIDSDDDPDCFIEVGPRTTDTVCESCRDVREELSEVNRERAMPRDWTPTPEQQAIIDASLEVGDGEDE